MNPKQLLPKVTVASRLGTVRFCGSTQFAPGAARSETYFFWGLKGIQTSEAAGFFWFDWCCLFGSIFFSGHLKQIGDTQLTFESLGFSACQSFGKEQCSRAGSCYLQTDSWWETNTLTDWFTEFDSTSTGFHLSLPSLFVGLALLLSFHKSVIEGLDPLMLIMRFYHQLLLRLPLFLVPLLLYSSRTAASTVAFLPVSKQRNLPLAEPS